MSDKDSAPKVVEGEDLPGSQTSQPTGGQPDSSSQPQINPLELLDNPDFVEGLRRVFQSEKDRGVNRVQKEVSNIREDLARLGERLGVPKEKIAEAQRQMDYEDAIEWVQQQRQASPQEPQGSGQETSGVIQGVLLAYGADPSDPGVQSVLAQNAGADAPQKLVAYLKTRDKQPPASPGGIAAPPGSAPATGEYANQNEDQLGATLLSLQRNYRANKPEIDKITAELERRDKRK